MSVHKNLKKGSLGAETFDSVLWRHFWSGEGDILRNTPALALSKRVFFFLFISPHPC